MLVFVITFYFNDIREVYYLNLPYVNAIEFYLFYKLGDLFLATTTESERF